MNKANLSKIQTVLNDMVNTQYSAGVNCLILQNGKEQGYFEAGYADIENKIPIKRDSIFRLYSMSKTITSVATMILVESGDIDLFDDVEKYLPGFKNPRVVGPDKKIVNATRSIRINDLLCMTSGIPYPGDLEDPAAVECGKLVAELIDKMDGNDALTTVEFANRLGKNPLSFEPGTHFMYGFSADILGAVIEVVSGMKYSEFLKKNIFDPLGMKNTGFYVPEDKRSQFTKVYECTPNGLTPYTYPFLGVSNSMQKAPSFESGGAGLCSCIDDFVAFSQMLLNGGIYKDVRILSPETVKFITTHTIPDALQPDLEKAWEHLSGFSYGCLMRIMKDATRAITLGSDGEYGWDGWTGTYIANIPEHKLTILIMQQRAETGTTEYTRKLRNIIFSSLE